MLNADELRSIVERSTPNLNPVRYQIEADSGITTVLEQLASRGGTNTGETATADSVWEYAQNAIDGARDDTSLQFNIVVQKGKKSGFISCDNGQGMTLEELRTLPEKVGTSVKRDDPSKIGKNATGALTWMNLGERVAWISKSANPDSRTVIFTTSRADLPRGKIGYASAELAEPGTYVLIDNLKETAERDLTIRNLERMLGENFSDFIDDGAVIRVTVGKDSKVVEPVRRYGGKNFVRDMFTFEVDGVTYEASAELYVHPKRPTQTVSVRSAGKVVVPNIANLGRFGKTKEVWGSDYVSGTIVSNMLPQTRTRTGLDMSSTVVDRFFDEVDFRYTENVRTQVEGYETRQRDVVMQGVYNKVSKAIRTVLETELRELVGTGLIGHPQGKTPGEYERGEDTSKPDSSGPRSSGGGSGDVYRPRRKIRQLDEGKRKGLESMSSITVTEADLGPEVTQIAKFSGGIDVLEVHKGHRLYIEAEVTGNARTIASHVCDAVAYALTLKLNSGQEQERALHGYIDMRRKIGDRVLGE